MVYLQILKKMKFSFYGTCAIFIMRGSALYFCSYTDELFPIYQITFQTYWYCFESFIDLIRNGVCLEMCVKKNGGRNETDNVFKRIFVNENVWISIKIPLKFVPKGPINNIAVLHQIMAWRHPAIIWTNAG